MMTATRESRPTKVTDRVSEVTRSLRLYVEKEDFAGYDPYDALTGWIPFQWGGKWSQALMTQLHKRNPINLRRVMGIPRKRNPKAIGLFLSAYSKLAARGEEAGAGRIADGLFDWLLHNQSSGYAGSCWGYPFDWVNPKKKVAAGVPSVVVTAFVAKGIWDYYQYSGEPKARETILSCCDYVLENLFRSESKDGLCFSYTHLQRDCCYNANLLAAEILAIGHRLTGDGEAAELARRSLDFTVAHQQPDGRWNYSLEPETGRERVQIDFHQGFVLDSFLSIVRLVDLKDSRYRESISRGAHFYRRKQFWSDGRSKWRLPKEWPAEIHNQAQGILTFSRLADFDPGFLSFAHTIADWTIEHMYDRRGYFYYQRFPRYTNKIAYMRWAQAWMLLALVELRTPLIRS